MTRKEFEVKRKLSKNPNYELVYIKDYLGNIWSPDCIPPSKFIWKTTGIFTYNSKKGIVFIPWNKIKDIFFNKKVDYNVIIPQ